MPLVRPRHSNQQSFGARAAADSETSAGSTPWTVGTLPTGAALVDGPPSGALLGAGATGHGCPERGADLYAGAARHAGR